MAHKIALVFLWFLLTPAALISSIIFLNQNSSKISFPTKITTNLTGNPNHIDAQVLGVEIADIRPFYVANFLNGTKLEPYSYLIVEVSDKYGLDYRLIPAIAMKESGGGNAVLEYTHNAWGWENGNTVFPSWEQAIETVGKTLKTRYADNGMVTPDEIMPIYAPPQVDTGGKWAKDVNYFFSQMESL